MRKGLRERCGERDSIQSFQLAAAWRFREGLSLASAGHRIAAIYLWGYTAEMVLKAAYFRAVGYEDHQQISREDLKAAKLSARELGLSWVGSFHNLKSWADLLLSYRNQKLKHVYETGFGSNVVIQVLRIQRLWVESLRYHGNFAYPHEMNQVHDATQWLLDHSSSL